METQQLIDFAVDKIDDLKGRDVEVIDVSDKSSIMDFIIVCSGNSKTHVKSIGQHVATEAKHQGTPAIGIEGADFGEWVLVDFGSIVVHVMLDDTREFYQIEKLWQ
ncbi:ribosome silencing factor [Saccharobesus litoralis]|uniref:Ribosomal silencing factor RsfS n=1 Tax=Saccharobesus litoralis TaxID=2172099 RepID=A0A2S0VVN9_9ALTE|nr:ribosome silencing factor [Saccharobesus litoralis]AWB68287.1 ribosome silencing factor [Saccharobesus litoralis]